MLFIAAIAAITSCKKDDPKPIATTQAACIKTGFKSYFNGSQTGTKTYVYNSNDLLVEEIGFDNDGAKTDSVHKTYDNKNNLTRSYYYSFSFGVSQTQKWSYYPDGKVKQYEFAIDGNVSTTDEYFYNKRGDIDSILSVTNGEPYKQYYLYENDTLKIIERYDEFGNLAESENYSYIGSTTTIITLDEQGQTRSRVEILYDEMGNQTEWRLYNGFGQLSIQRYLEYDEKGNNTKVTDIYGRSVYVYETTWQCSN